MADYAIHDTTLSGIANVIRKKDGTSALIDPADYEDRIDLMGMLEEKTASGSVVVFSDGADDVKLKSYVATIDPNLTGTDSVDIVQTGKNLVSNSASAWESGTINSSGNNASGSGTRTIGYYEIQENAQFIISGIVSPSTSSDFRIFYYDKNKNFLTYKNYSVTYLTTPANARYFRLRNVSVDDISTLQIEYGDTATTYEPYIAPTTYTADLDRTIYGGSVDVVNGTGTDENGNDFTFDPVEIRSLLGSNAMWADSGASSVVYRSSGTETIIQPTLISKTITENGTYSAEDDNADGYDEVTVNVPTGTTEPFKVLSINGTAGSETFTADKAGTYMFLVATSAQGTASITSAVTPDLTFSKQSSDNRGLVGAIYTLAVGDTVTMSNSVVSWVYNTKVVVEMNISVSAVIDSTIVNDGTITSFSPSVTGNALFISMAGGRSADNSYDRTYTNLNDFEFFGKVETGIFLRIRYGSTVPSYQLYGYDGGCALAIALSVNAPSLLMGGLGSSNSEEENTNSEQEEAENESD